MMRFSRDSRCRFPLRLLLLLPLHLLPLLTRDRQRLPLLRMHRQSSSSNSLKEKSKRSTSSRHWTRSLTTRCARSCGHAPSRTRCCSPSVFCLCRRLPHPRSLPSRRRLFSLLPSISLDDSQRRIAIVAYTFGAFFTQCLLHHSPPSAPQDDTDNEDDEDENSSALVTHALHVAERFTPVLLLSKSLPPPLVAEGLVAVVGLALARPSSSSSSRASSRCVLHASLRLVRSLFQRRHRSTLDFVTATPRGVVTTRLRAVLGAVLVSRRLWTRPTRLAKTAIDRQWLQTLRLLYDQQETRASLVAALVPSTEEEQRKDNGESTRENRLRSLRWVLQQQQRRKQRDAALTSEQTAAIRSCCERLLPPTSEKENGTLVLRRLASECLALLERLDPEHAHTSSNSKSKESRLARSLSLDAQLASLRRHLQQQQQTEDDNDDVADERDDREAAAENAHESLDQRDLLSPTQRDALVRHTARYFQLHARPDALYAHAFTVESLEGHDGAFERGQHLVPRRRRPALERAAAIIDMEPAPPNAAAVFVHVCIG
ncbi:hypothetical protein PINS_up002219 [Pythium insidiosum]|nr:hypothetical protein PINS_up002219 [Pythium insidiosum]